MIWINSTKIHHLQPSPGSTPSLPGFSLAAFSFVLNLVKPTIQVFGLHPGSPCGLSILLPPHHHTHLWVCGHGTGNLEGWEVEQEGCPNWGNPSIQAHMLGYLFDHGLRACWWGLVLCWPIPPFEGAQCWKLLKSEVDCQKFCSWIPCQRIYEMVMMIRGQLNVHCHRS